MKCLEGDVVSAMAGTQQVVRVAANVYLPGDTN